MDDAQTLTGLKQEIQDAKTLADVEVAKLKALGCIRQMFRSGKGNEADDFKGIERPRPSGIPPRPGTASGDTDSGLATVWKKQLAGYLDGLIAGIS